MAINKVGITIEEFEAFLAEHPNGLYELIHGEIIEKVPTQEHSKIAGIIIGELYIYLRQHPDIQAHMGPEARFRAKDDTQNDRLPDVSLHLTTEPVVDKGAVEGMPDLAVEIKSPDDSLAELRAKARYYCQKGSRLVWLVYTEKRLVEVYESNGNEETLTENDSLDGKGVLPNFSLPVKSLFPSKA